MNEDIIKKLSERLNELPKMLQEAVLAPELAQKIQKIGSANGLSEQKIQGVEDEIVFVLLVYREYPDFPSRILALLENQVEIARNVTNAITEQVFTPEVRGVLDAIYAERNELETGKNSPQDLPITNTLAAQSTIPASTETPNRSAYVIPSYQKPLMGVPRYQNTLASTPISPQASTVPPVSPTPPQPPAPPHM